MAKGRYQRLIIAPHVDDEVLGCGGILDKRSFVYYCGINEARVASDQAHRIPLKDRKAELKKTADYLGFGWEVNEKSLVNFYVIQDFIAELERVVNIIKPQAIFLPHPGYNQDHKTIFDAAQVALRPHDKNFFIKRVLGYEGIHDFLWSHEKFQANYFVPIDVERKLKAYSLMPSQVRGMRSPDMLRHLASLRGAQAGVPHAEAFSVLRWVES